MGLPVDPLVYMTRATWSGVGGDSGIAAGAPRRPRAMTSSTLKILRPLPSSWVRNASMAGGCDAST